MELGWTHITQRNRSNTENCVRLGSSGIQKKGETEENVAKDNRRLNKRHKKIME
jgi:hypothetical protein